MGSVNFIMKITLLPMKGIGRMISLMGKEESIIQNPSNSNKNSITKIFLSWEIDGCITKVNSKMIQNMEKDT